MTPKKTSEQERKDTILEIVVDQYIQTVTPVSSGFIAQEFHLDLSPATIRNILVDLEEEGYLMHPHTSAGRMPTEQGYRYYVDNLMHEINLLEEEKERIRQEYYKEVKDLETLLDQASQVLSDVTQYTTIISVDGWGSKIFCRGTSHVISYPDINDLSKIKSIIRTLEEKERIVEVINRNIEERVKIFIGQESACEEMDHCSLVISRYQVPQGLSGRIAVLGPTCMNYERVVSALDYFSDLMKTVK